MFIHTQKAVAEDWIYTVRPGDTLWDLCYEYTNVSNCWQLVGPYNNVDFPPSLLPGTRIRFPVKWLRLQPQPVIVTFVKGNAQKISNDGNSSEVKIADELSVGMRLIVSEDSTVALRFADGSTMLVESASELVFDRLSFNGKEGMVDTRVNLLRGAVQNKVPKKRQGLNFEVSTPSAVAAVRGTDFRVVSENKGTEATMRSSVYDGLVSVSNNKDETELPKAFGLVARKNQPLPEKVRLLDPPVLKNKVNNPSLMPFALSWGPLKNASAYKVELLNEQDNSIVPLSKVTDKTTFVINDIAPACYTLSLSAIDTLGIQGLPSKEQLCLVEPLDKPEVAADNAVSKDGVLSWNPVQGAAKYRIDIDVSESFSSVQSLWSDTNSVVIEKDTRSHRYVRIVAVDRHGYTGLPSDTLKVEKKSKGFIGLDLFLSVVTAILLI